MRVFVGELFAFCDLHASRARPLLLSEPLDSLDQGELSFGPRPQCYDRQGFPIPGDFKTAVLDWAVRATDLNYVIVALDELPDGSELSTVWLGLDHGYFGRPLFFETMRFGDHETFLFAMEGQVHEFDSRMTLPYPDPESGEDTTQLRYGSEERALAMHHEILRRLRKRWEC